MEKNVADALLWVKEIDTTDGMETFIAAQTKYDTIKQLLKEL